MSGYICLLLLIFSSLSFCHAAGSPPLSPVWFQHIQTPMPLSPGQGEKIAADLRSMLLAQKSDEEILKAMPEDANPRIIFLALGDGEWPERIAFNTGETFRTALKNTLTTLREREKKYPGIIQQQQKRLEEQAEGRPAAPSDSWLRKLKNPTQWNSLRITIVQKSRQYENFSIALSKILLSNVNGIAFPRSAGFAFPPEQIAGRYLMTPEHFFNSNQIGNILSESENFQSMSTWLQLTTSTPPFPVILFDCASFHADAAGAVRLFHSHSTGLQEPSPGNLLRLAENCGRMLLPLLRPNGTLKPPFPEWICSVPGKEHPIALAELSIALSRLHAASGDKAFSAAAAKINRGLGDRLRKYKTAGGQHRCLVEREILEEPDNPQEPRRIVNTYTNAIAALAMLEYQRCTGNEEFRHIAEELVRHLINVQQNNGGFRSVFVYPGMHLPAEKYFTEEGENELTALASLTLFRFMKLAGGHPELALDRRIHRSRSWLCGRLRRYAGPGEMPASIWISEYLAAVNEENQKELTDVMERAAIAANLKLETSPVLPDLFGSVESHSGMTLSAERTWITAVTAENLFRHGQETQGRYLLSACWMQLMFQLQAIMDPASASPLPQPCRYRGFFRDNLDAYSFNLTGQSTQILSLLAVRNALTVTRQPRLSPSPETAEMWRDNWRKLDRSPVILTPDLIINNARAPESVRRIGGSIQGTATTTRFQGHGGKIMGTSRNPSGRILETPRPQKKSPRFGIPAP